MKTTLRDWDDPWSTPKSRIEQAAPLVALALAALVALL